MDLALLDTLKTKLIQATNFSDVFTYFLDHFGENPEFMDLGERVSHPFLEQILTEIGRQLFGKTVPLADVILKHLPEQQFLHGGAILGGKMATVIYFEDIYTGLMAITWTFSPPETKFSRFRGQPLPPRKNLDPSVN